MGKAVQWFRGWIRRHPILSGIWVLFFLLCVVSMFAAPDGESPDLIYGVVILPLMALVAILYFGRTVDRFKKIKDLSSQRDEIKRQRLQDETVDQADSSI